jgi:hypothetical protein
MAGSITSVEAESTHAASAPAAVILVTSTKSLLGGLSII